MTSVARLLEIMARLRDPEGGCPWDLEQRFETIAPYTIEEAYEVEDAILRGDMAALREELGDLLLQVVYHAQLAREAGHFDFDEVARAIGEKLVRRHPHVFGKQRIDSAAAQTRAWEAHKAAERERRAREAGRAPGVLEGVPLALPALLRAAKLQGRAARAGYDWARDADARAKLHEELGELERELDAGAPRERVQEELGDLLFACAGLARRLDLDAETALREACHRFEARLRRVEEELARQARRLEDAGAAELLALWQRAKDGGDRA